MTKIFTKEDVIPESQYKNFSGEWVILRTEGTLAEGYRSAKYQLWYCTGGFGADPSKMGTKIFGIFAYDNDAGMICIRSDILGIAKPETIAEWEKEYPEAAQNIESIWNDHH